MVSFELISKWCYDFTQIVGLITGCLMKRLSALIELVGISMVSAGLGVEFITKADVGYMIISTGSVIIAMGSILYAKLAKD